MRYRTCIGLAACILALVGSASWSQPLGKQSASEGNRIELEVVNSTATPLKDVIVDVEAIPTWLTFETTPQSIGTLAAGESKVVVFKFDQDERAIPLFGALGEMFLIAVRVHT